MARNEAVEGLRKKGLLDEVRREGRKEKNSGGECRKKREEIGVGDENVK